jgi:tetratricopeptide (TPR) repeat protein
MIRVLFYIIVFLTSQWSLNAQESRYEAGMQKGFLLWQEGKPTEALQMFERIAAAEKENWIPSYYSAYLNTMYAFNTKDVEKLSLVLKKAQDYTDKAVALSPDNAELLILQALIHTAWIAHDGQTYGVKLAARTTALHQKAMALAPNNPRVVLSNAEWNMGSARFFGKDTSTYCKDIAKALELFATFKSELPFYPSWGKERAQQLLQSCQAK